MRAATIRGIAVRHIPRDIPDSADQVRETLDIIDTEIREGRAVYVHCWGGVGRTGIVVGCHLVRYGMTGEQAPETRTDSSRRCRPGKRGVIDRQEHHRQPRSALRAHVVGDIVMTIRDRDRPRAIEVIPHADGFDVRLDDGRRLFTPYSWFPRLEATSPAQRANREIIGDGIGIHWPDIDEDLSVAGLLRGVRAPGASDLAGR